jgi:subtilisin family serine protease
MVCAAALLAALAAAAAAAPIDAAALSPPPAVVPDEFLLKFKPGVTAAQRDGFLSGLGARGVEPLGRMGALRIRLPGPAGAETAARLTGHPLLEYAEPDFVYRATTVPADPLFPQLWALRNTGQTGGTPGADIRAVEAWDLASGAPEIAIGILDSGIDFAHADLAANLYTNPGEIPANGADDDGNGFVDDVHGWDFVADDNDPQDDNGHGTAMAGVAGARGDNGVGMTGVCWRVQLLPLKFLNAQGTGTTANAVRALDYAVGLGVPVTSNSWGGGPFSQALFDAITAADEAGVLFVTSSGGSGANLDEYPAYPASYDVPNVVVAAATDDEDSLYAASGYGPKTVDLGAPGVDILTAWPGASYRLLSGSSLATAFVAGALALVLARHPGLSGDDAATHLLDRVEALPSLAGLVRTKGRLDLYRPLAEPPATAVAPDPGGAPAGRSPRVWWQGSDADGIRLGMELPRAGEARLEIFDVRGRRVCRLFAGTAAAGRQVVTWDGRDGRGARAARGLYLARLAAGPGVAVTRFVSLR